MNLAAERQRTGLGRNRSAGSTGALR